MGRQSIGTACFAIAALVAPAMEAGAQNGAAPTWKGRYRYEFDGGKTASGSAIAITHDLAVVPGAARGGCLLAITGFQSDERIVCHAGGDAERVGITFHGYEDGRTVNRYGVAVYKPGQALLTLERRNGKVLTRWEGFRPDLPADAPNPGAYFAPVR